MTLSFPKSLDRATKSDSLIVDFLEMNKDKILMLTINDVATSLDISDATVSRFAKKVGYKDFKDLKNDIYHQSQYLGALGKMEKTLSEEDMLNPKSYLKNQILNLEKTIDHLDLADFERACQTISQARKVWIYGKHASRSLGEFLKFRLSRLGLDVGLLSSGGSELVESLARIQECDAILIFSFSKSSWEARVCLDYSRKNSITSIGFYSRLHLPDDEKPDIEIFSYRGGPGQYPSNSSSMALIDSLVVNISKLLEDRSMENLEHIKNLKTYYKDF